MNRGLGRSVAIVVAALALFLVVGTTSAQAVTPTPTPTLTAATSTTPTATRTPTSTPAPATRTPTHKPSPTRIPGPRIEWSTRWLDVELAPGVLTQQTLTFQVTQPVAQASVRAFSQGSTMAVGDIPAILQPGQDYTLRIGMMLPEDHRQWPLRGTIMVRSGHRTIGPIVSVRGRGPSQPSSGGDGGIRTPTATPSRDRTPSSTATPTPVAARVTWSPTTLHQSLASGESATVTVSFKVTRAIDSPQFRAYTRDGAISIDPSSLPAALEPGQSYDLRLVLRMGTRHSAEVGTVLVRQGRRSLGEALIIRLPPGS